MTPNEFGTWLYGRNGWCNGRPVLPWVVDVTTHVLGPPHTRRTTPPHAKAAAPPRRNVTLEYSAMWCAAPGVCSPPDPGPPSTWQQAPPVMMVALYVVLGDAPPAEPSWWAVQAVQLGGIGVLSVAVMGSLSAWSTRRRVKATALLPAPPPPLMEPLVEGAR